MKHYKSERLKKLETELTDLERWLELDLVPKRDVKKYKEEIKILKGKIEEEKERIQFLRESGEIDELAVQKRPQQRGGYTEMATMTDFEGNEATTEATQETQAEQTSETTLVEEKEEITILEDENESYFSDKRRWRRGARGGILDPDAEEW